MTTGAILWRGSVHGEMAGRGLCPENADGDRGSFQWWGSCFFHRPLGGIEVQSAIGCWGIAPKHTHSEVGLAEKPMPSEIGRKSCFVPFGTRGGLL